MTAVTREPGITAALDALRAGRKDEAIALLRQAIRENPDNVDALRCLADAYWRENGHLSDTEALLRRVTVLAPDQVPAWMLLGALLHQTGRHPESIEAYREATRLEPANAAAWGELANVYAHAGRLDDSADAYSRSLALEPDSPCVQMGYGQVLKIAGDRAGSIGAYRAAIACKPDFGEAYWSLAGVDGHRFEDAEVAAMERQLKRDELGASAGIHFHFALGKAWHDKGDYERAWIHYQSGNRRQRGEVFHDPVSIEVRHEEIIEVFGGDFLERHAGAGDESSAPIFIVGLPRSGLALVERILASHGRVEATAGLPGLDRLATSIGRYRPDDRHYPHTVRDLGGSDFLALGRQYLDGAGAYRTTSRPHFTDRQPGNFSHVGLLHLILPNAKVIDVRRHPLDTCLGAYRQLFGRGQNFTYDMEELAAYYRQYHETMRHWHRVLPGKVLDVHYEDLVVDPESQVRRILAHCGLDIEDACFRVHEFGTGAAGTWRRYEKQLGAWRVALADILEELPENVRNAGLQP